MTFCFPDLRSPCSYQLILFGTTLIYLQLCMGIIKKIQKQDKLRPMFFGLSTNARFTLTNERGVCSIIFLWTVTHIEEVKGKKVKSEVFSLRVAQRWYQMSIWFWFTLSLVLVSFGLVHTWFKSDLYPV